MTCGMPRRSGLGNPILFCKESATSPDFLSWSLLGNSGSYCSVTTTRKTDVSYDIWMTIAWTILNRHRDWEYTVVIARYRRHNVVALYVCKAYNRDDIDVPSLPKFKFHRRPRNPRVLGMKDDHCIDDISEIQVMTEVSRFMTTI
jgi:hypothetical protein